MTPVRITNTERNTPDTSADPASATVTAPREK